MLYQLSYTPSADARGNDAGCPAQGHLTIGSPIQVPPWPVNTFWVAA